MKGGYQMDSLYAAAYEITKYGIQLLENKKISPNVVCRLYGFEFTVSGFDDQFFRATIYAYNKYASGLQGVVLERENHKIGGIINTPILINTDDHFTGEMCSYLFLVSRAEIDTGAVLSALGVNVQSRFTGDDYQKLKEKFDISDRITGFQELMNHIQRDAELNRQTEYTIKNTRVYNESFLSDRMSYKTTTVSFQENLTLLAARDPAESGKHTAILNFANPVEPGGGTVRGDKAQEESICRSSNLYKVLTSVNANNYYQSNRKIRSKNQYNSVFLGTDKVLYAPDVLILKEAAGYKAETSNFGKEEYIDHPFKVDVITSSAPFFSGLGYWLPDGDLQHLFERRIQNILEAAIENEVEVIVLGAFGCGYFHNSPNIVADAFREVLLDARYKNAFDEIIFAVSRSHIICPNIEAFQKNFSFFPELNLQGSEMIRRESARWECSCGIRHSWDVPQCSKCKMQRKDCKRVFFIRNR